MFRKRPRDNESGESGKELARRDAAPPAAQSQAPTREASLEFLGGPRNDEKLVLTRIVTLIGRDETCDVAIDDSTVSREHGQIEQTVGQWVYTNFSENGTWINRKRAERVALSDGDILEIGSQTRIRFRLQEVQPTTVVAPVRRRPRRTREEIEAEAAQDETQEQKPRTVTSDLFKRRKVIIGLAAYLAAMVALFAFLGLRSDNGDSGPPMAERFEPEDLARWLDTLNFGLPRDMGMAAKKLKEAEQLYSGYQFGAPMDLYNAVRAFQEASEYAGGGRIRDFKYQKMFTDAKRDLVHELWTRYRDALVAEAQQNRLGARHLYWQILQRIPDSNNPRSFYAHIRYRLSRL